MTQRDWQKDMEMCKGFLEDSGWSRRDLIAEQPQMSMYWLQEAKRLEARANAAEERERRLIKAYTGRDKPAPKEGDNQ